MNLTFLHAADLHIDSPLRGLERYPGAPVEDVRLATRRAFTQLVTLAIDEGVKLVIIAGDVYDGSWKDYATGMEVNTQLRRLSNAGIRVVMISGNHDAAARMERSLELPDGVYHLSSDAPQTMTFQEIDVAVHGQSFAKTAVYDDLSADYPDPVPGMVNIGVLHTSGDGAEGHEPYAPCSILNLQQKGYDYWALGHVHQRRVLSTEPHIVFSGNLQGRHIRETGAKGCYLVDVQDGLVQEPRFVACDVMRWELAELDLSEVEHESELFRKASDTVRSLVEEADGRVLAVRVKLIGHTPLHSKITRRQGDIEHQLRNTVSDASGGQAWVERVIFGTALPRSADEIAAQQHALEEFLPSLESLLSDTDATDALFAEANEDLFEKLSDLGEFRDELPDSDDEAGQREMLREARDLLIEALLNSGADEG